MSFLFSELRRITHDLNQSAIGWCLVGGLGTSVYIDPRTTKDIDVVVSVSNGDEAERLRDFLLALGYTAPQLLMHTSPTRRMGWRVFIPTCRATSIPLDLLVAACGIEQDIVAGATVLEVLPGLTLPVASRGHLISMKVLSQNPFDRLQDRVDLIALLRSASDEDRSVAEQALRKIAQAGFAGSRDLIAELRDIELAKGA